MIGIHKIGRQLPYSVSRINSKVGADTMPFEIMSLLKRRNIDYQVVNDVNQVSSGIDTLIIVSGVSKVFAKDYRKLQKTIGNIIYLIDDPKLTQGYLVELSNIVMEPSIAVRQYQNGLLFPPELWAASYSYSMVDPGNHRTIRLIYWGSDTGPKKSERLEKYFQNHSVANNEDVLYLKSQKYNYDTRVDIDILETTRSCSKFTICVNDRLLTDRQYFNGRIYEAIVSGIMPIADIEYNMYNGFKHVPVVKDRKTLEYTIQNLEDKERITIVRDIQELYRTAVVKAEDVFLEVLN